MVPRKAPYSRAIVFCVFHTVGDRRKKALKVCAFQMKAHQCRQLKKKTKQNTSVGETILLRLLLVR